MAGIRFHLECARAVGFESEQCPRLDVQEVGLDDRLGAIPFRGQFEGYGQEGAVGEHLGDYAAGFLILQVLEFHGMKQFIGKAIRLQLSSQTFGQGNTHGS